MRCWWSCRHLSVDLGQGWDDRAELTDAASAQALSEHFAEHSLTLLLGVGRQVDARRRTIDVHGGQTGDLAHPARIAHGDEAVAPRRSAAQLIRGAAGADLTLGEDDEVIAEAV